MSTSFDPFERNVNSNHVNYRGTGHNHSILSSYPGHVYWNLKHNITLQPDTSFDHPFLPYRIERRRVAPLIEPRTTTAPISRPPKLHHPKPDKRFVEAPFWLSQECEWDAKGNPLPPVTASVVRAIGRDNIPLPNHLNTNMERHLERSSISPSSTESLFGSASNSTSPTSALNSDSGTSSPVDQATDVVFQALQLAEYVLEMNDMWEDRYRRNNQEELLKQWQAIYALVRIAIERSFDAIILN